MPVLDAGMRARWGWVSLTALVVYPAAWAEQRPIHVEVDLVLVPVTVADGAGRIVTGLGAENFRLFEDRAPQRIAYFSQQETPCSMALVFDRSGSMGDKLDKARLATRRLLESGHPLDELLLIPFADRPRAEVSFTRDTARVQNSLLWTAAGGGTALFDAVYLGLDRLRSARHPRRALVVVSDGGDNHSRHSKREVLALAAEANVQLWAVGIHENPQRREEQGGALLLEEVARASGGRHFWVRDHKELEEAAARIGELVHHQYVIGYYPSGKEPEGKWRRIEVRADRRGVRVYGRGGYRASRD